MLLLVTLTFVSGILFYNFVMQNISFATSTFNTQMATLLVNSLSINATHIVAFLQFLNSQPIHGYQIITKIRRPFGVYFGPSAVYPLLSTLEKKGYVTSEWNMKSERPRKVYKLTSEGQTLLNFTEESFNRICRRIETDGVSRIDLEAGEVSSDIPRFQKETKPVPAFAR